jgi:replicative DNA helicase
MEISKEELLKESEKGVIGNALIDNSMIPALMEIVEPSQFYSEAGKIAWRKIKKMDADSRTIDQTFLSMEIFKDDEAREQVPEDYVQSCYEFGQIIPCPKSHAKHIVEHDAKRKIERAGQRLWKNQSDDPRELTDMAREYLDEITEQFESSEDDIVELGDGLINTIEEVRSGDESEGLRTGLTDLDSKIGGVQGGEYCILAGRPSMGKCLGKGTKVVMYDGSLKRVENVKKGDKLMGPDSEPREVLALGSGTDDLYKIKQKNGVDYVVNSEHKLTLMKTRKDGRGSKGDIIDISLSDFIDGSSKLQTSWCGFKTDVQFEYKHTEVDPYLIGLWLGDGNNKSSIIHSGDEEILNWIRDYAKNNRFRASEKTGESCDAITLCRDPEASGKVSFTTILERLNLRENKHIPQKYIANTEFMRWRLLAGLIDSDGHKQKNQNSYEITQKRKRLAEDIKYLCDTLGLRTSICEKKANKSTYWRVRISGDLMPMPVQLERKKPEKWTDKRNPLISRLDIEHIGKGEYYGFEITGDGRFLLEDMTVTHNTSLLRQIAWNVSENHPVGFVSAEMTAKGLIESFLITHSGISYEDIRKGYTSDKDEEKIRETIREFNSRDIFIDRCASTDVSHIINRIRILKKTQDIQAVFIDYVQLLTLDEPVNREAEVNKASRRLKQMAQNLDLSIYVAAQLNRQVERRDCCVPKLSDLRDSGGLEQDADYVLLLWRPEYYGILDKVQEIENVPSSTAIIVAKQRQGETGPVNVTWKGDRMKFVNFVPEPESF